MKSVEELKAKHVKELAELEARMSLELAVPKVTDHKLQVTMQSRSAPWITYGDRYGTKFGGKQMTMAEALAIFDSFPEKVGMEDREGTFRRVQPTSEFKARELEDSELKGSGYCAMVVNEGNTGIQQFPVELVFYAKVDGRVVRVGVHFGEVAKLRIRGEETKDFHRRVASRTFRMNNTLFALADAHISFSDGTYGPVKTGYDHRHLFLADDAECTEFTHFEAQMETLGSECGL